MEKNLRPINLTVKVDPLNKDTRGLVIEAKEIIQSSPHFDDWTAVSFEHKGLEVNVRRDDEIDDIVRWVEMNAPRVMPSPVVIQRQTDHLFRGEECIHYSCNPSYSKFLNPN